MIKIMLAFSLLSLGACLGTLFANKYYKRTTFYKSLKQFNETFINELSFCRSNLKFILSKDYQSIEFNKILQQVSEQINNTLIIKLDKNNFLTENDLFELQEYFSSLGKSDCDTQLRILNTYRNIFDQKLQEAQSEQTKYGALCKKTGIIIGLIAFIIVV